MVAVSLNQHLLIAMPHLQDPYFANTVIYINKHNKKGANGFIINKALNIDVGNLLKAQWPQLPLAILNKLPIMFGGPINKNHITLLHRKQIADENDPSASHQLNKKHLLSGNLNIFLGHAVWESGQLEQELRENAWLIAPVQHELVYDIPIDARYHVALQMIGVDPSKLVYDMSGFA